MAEKIFTVDKFLGLNESADSATELKLGEASKIENFTITDGYNLKIRPGISRYAAADGTGYNNTKYVRAWKFFSGKYEYLAVVQNFSEGLQVLRIFRNGVQVTTAQAKVFYTAIPWNGEMCFIYWSTSTAAREETASPLHLKAVFFKADEDGKLKSRSEEDLYLPMVTSQSKPSGGGAILEPLNLLSRAFRESFVGDGTSTEYVLKSFAAEVPYLIINGKGESVRTSIGTYDAATHTFTFQTAPEDQAEVEFWCYTDDDELYAARDRLLKMPYTELYNGATDTRVFFYGDGSNLCYYTGAPAFGDGLYVPAGNELAVDFSNSAITGLVRHYSRLLAFKPDGVDAISYEPVTLADGSVIAGFYLRPVSRAYGNEATGQVALVNNYARSLAQGSIYEWRISSYSYKDERYSKLISQKISKTIGNADMSKIVTCDDEKDKTYYVFINDEEGTVLVNRYDLDVWSIYRSELTTNVTQAFVFEGKLMFLCDGTMFMLDPDSTVDAPLEESEDTAPINCVWESGYMAFGADFRRKYSSNIWVSMLPEVNSRMEITVQTDRRDVYLEKVTGLPLLDFSHIDFSNFSFLRSLAPQIKRIKIKVKKFVYYKLIFRINHKGARATVLGYDQQIRYSSNVK